MDENVTKKKEVVAGRGSDRTKRKSKTIKQRQTLVDKALVELNEKQKAEWSKLVRANTNYSDLRLWLGEQGFAVSIQNISRWWIANRPRGNEAIAINKLTETYAGTDGGALLQMAAIHIAKLVTKLSTEVDENLSSASIESKLTAIVNLLRELRQAADSLNKSEVTGDREALVKAGCYQLAEELKLIFKGSAFELALESGLQAAFTKINIQ